MLIGLDPVKKMISGGLLALLLLIPSGARTWTSQDGRELEAELVSQDVAARKVTIKRSDGKEFTLSIDTLSEADREWLKEKQEEAEAERAERNKLAGTTVKLTSEGKLPTTCHVYYPTDFDAAVEHPMILMFSPGGNGAGILRSVKAACDELGFIGVGCDTFKNGGPSEEYLERFEDLLPFIEENVSHDKDQLYMGGFSGGALRAYEYSGQFKRDWKGILAFGGWLGPGGDQLETAKGMRVAIVNGEDDKNANHYVERDSGILKGRRCKVEVMHFPGGHVVAPADVTTKALRWIAEK